MIVLDNAVVEKNVLIVPNAISIEVCEKICLELASKHDWQDKVMTNRLRLQNSDKKFERFLSHSPNSKRLYDACNSYGFVSDLSQFLNDSAAMFINEFHENYFIRQASMFGRIANIIRRSMLAVKFTRHRLSLQFDFSEAGIGYYREPHLDSPNRYLVFLFYFNDATTEGGDLWFSKWDERRRTFALKTEVAPRAGTLVAFISDKNSYHGVSPKLDANPRYFCYGGFSKI